MNTTVKGTLSVVFLVLAILWFAIFALLEVLYIIRVFMKEPGIYYALRTILNEQAEGINPVITIILLMPGIGAFHLYKRFKSVKISD